MEIYNVDLNDAMSRKHNRVRIFFIMFMCITLTYFVVDRFWPRHPPLTLTASAIKAIFFGLVLGAIQSSRNRWLSLSKSWMNYQIVVDENEITTRNFNSYSRMLSKTVRRGEVRTAVEKELGLLISSRGRFGTRFFGGILIPKQLADYEYLKRLVLSWRTESSS